MKKFLSLVLALVMTMSLVTISAGATEYKDLTDKDEIQYEEAVAVLNRLGIITGYTDGSFQPKTELTRGAAAKIIVSLLIGPEAAGNLVATSAPYTDVPVDHTFAAVISYCKNSHIIDGYSDGSFRPLGTLSGYAFAKMLLGALGYKSEYEGGFTGAGWTMNVARIGNECGLFDRLTFKGNETVNREQACQLALNTLKSTMVDYTGGLTITSGDATITGAATRIYKTSNQEYATHIKNLKASEQGSVTSTDTLYTVEFGEEHFVDLRMDDDRTAYDDFGRPSNKWSYKKVTIGTYPVEPDFVYTTQVAHQVDTAANKIKALGLRGYKTSDGVDGGGDPLNKTEVFFNGLEISDTIAAGNKLPIETIADLTDNGTTVEVYIDRQVADLIERVVVTQTQLMEVKKVGSDYVSLDKIGMDNDDPARTKASDFDLTSAGAAGLSTVKGYNQPAIDVSVKDVKDDDDAYSVLSALKAEDKVAIIPVTTDDGASWEVAEAYVPETVSGRLSRVDTYADKAVKITVGDTAYNIAPWNKDMLDIDATSIKATIKDVTLTLDKTGNALLADDVGASEEYMVIGSYALTLQDGELVHLVKGWDISGNPISLNVGTTDYEARGMVPGDLVMYTNKGVTGTAEWKLLDDTANAYIYDVALSTGTEGTPSYNLTEIKSTNSRIPLKNVDNGAVESFYYKSGVKFIFVNFEDDTEKVDSIEIVKSIPGVTNPELAKNNSRYSPNSRSNSAQAARDGEKGDVQVVVVKADNNTATTNNILFVKDYEGSHEVILENGEKVYGYKVAMNTPDGVKDDEIIYSNKLLDKFDFATYTKTTHDKYPDNFYTLKLRDNLKVNISTLEGMVSSVYNQDGKLNKQYLRVTSGNRTSTNEVLTEANCWIMNDRMVMSDEVQEGYKGIVSIPSSVKWVALDNRNDYPTKVEEVANYSNVKLALLVNDNVDNEDAFRTVYMVIVMQCTKIDGAWNGSQNVDGTSVAWTAERDATNGDLQLSFAKPTAPAFAADDAKTATVTYTYEVFVNGVSKLGPVSTGATNLSQSATPTAIDTNVEVKSDDNVQIVVTDATWSQVNVRYFNAAGTELDPVAGDIFNAVPTKALAQGASKSLTFAVKSAAAVDYTVEDAGDEIVPNGNATVTTGVANGSSTISVSGKGYIDVKLGGLARSWSNPVAAGLGVTDASYVAADWNNLTTVTADPGQPVNAPIVFTGVAGDVERQLKSAVAFALDVAESAVTVTEGTNSYTVSVDGSSYFYTYPKNSANAKILVTVEGVKKLVASNATVTTLSLGVTSGLAAGETVGTTMVPVKAADAVKPGASYAKDKFVELKDLPSAAAGWTAAYDTSAANAGTSDSKNWVEIGKKIKVVYTADAAIDLSAASSSATMTLVGVNADDLPEYEGEATLKGASDSTVLVASFDVGAGKTSIAKGDTITFTYTIAASMTGGFALTSNTWSVS